jgi:hypothetical protein
MGAASPFVVPAQAGTQSRLALTQPIVWIPAYAGLTRKLKAECHA